MGKNIMKTKYLIISLAVITIFAVSCAKKEPAKSKYTKEAPASAEDKNGALKQKVLAFNLEGFTQKGTKSWEVKGESAEVISEDQIKLDNIVAKAYGEESEAVITGEKGIYDKTKNNVRLEKNVKATIENAESFSGADIGFPSPLVGSTSSKKDNPVKGQKRRIIITCDGEVQFDYEKNQAYFSRNVKVVSEDGNIESDKITINLDPATKKLKDIVGEGNVKITRGENVTYSEKAI